MTRQHDLWRRVPRASLGQTGAADADLLRRFDRAGDGDAFAELVARHGPVVYAACRRVLADPADVEDAFQATFLVLVTRAGSVSGAGAGGGLGPWLYRVAVLTARNLRRRAARRVTARLGAAVPAPSGPSLGLRLDLDAALLALPAGDRAAVVLCHLQGWSRRDAAAHLGCPEGTLSARLSRALARLRRRFGGADPVPVLAAAGAVVPAALAGAAARAAVPFRAGGLSAAAASPSALALTQGVLRMFWLKKAATVGLVCAAITAAGVGVGLTGAADPPAIPVAAPPPAKPKPDPLDAEIEGAKAKVETAKALLQQLEAQKARRAAEAAAEPRVEVDLSDAGGWGPDVRVTEYVRRGDGPAKPVGVLGCYNVDVLTTTLARMRHDPAAPKRLVLRIEPRLPEAKARPVRAACAAAGFESFEVGQLPWSSAADANRKIPRPPYTIEPPDILQIEAYRAAADGGRHPLPDQLVNGSYLVRPDGTVKLGKYGAVSVAGLTTEAAMEAVRNKLFTAGVTPKGGALTVLVDVSAYNSKCYYIVTDVAGNGEQVVRLPATGNETVLDAVSMVGGATASPKQVWVARPTAAGNADQILPVDWPGITQHGVTATNYQLLAGDRLYVKAAKPPAPDVVPPARR